MSNPDPPSQSLPGPAADVLSARLQEMRAWRPFGLLQAAQQRLPWLWPYGGVALVIFVAMWPAFTTTSRLIIGGDTTLIHYPWFVYWRDQIAAGHFPLWNPYTFSGFPAFATPQAGYAYPAHWAVTWLPSVVAINWLVGLHVLLAGVGTAWCAGRLGASKDGQFLAGIVFALGSATTARLAAGHLSFVESIAWLPLATGLAVTMHERHRVWQMGVVVGLMATAAQPELLIFSAWWLPLWAGGMALQQGRRQAAVAIARTLCGLALGAGLAAFFLLPVAELEGISNRAGDLAWEFRVGISLPIWHLLGLVNPEVFGSPGSATSGYWPGPGNYWHEYLLYVGFLTLLIALAARGKVAALCALSAVLAIVLSFGSNTPVYALVDEIPGYSEFRVPPKHLLLASLAIALAAGLSIDRLNTRRVAIFAAIGSVALLIVSQMTGTWLPPMVELLGGSDAVPTKAGLRDVADRAAGPLVIAAILVAALSLVSMLPTIWARRGIIALVIVELVVVVQPFWIERADPAPFLEDASRYKGDLEVAVTREGALIGNFGQAVQMRQPSGYTSMFSGGYQELVSGARNPGVVVEVSPGDERIALLLGYDGTSERSSGIVVKFEPPPRDAWVARCSWPGGASEARAAGFPLFNCITREAVATPEPLAASGLAEVVDEGTASLKVTAEGPGWLVTTIPWYPGWSAKVDGEGGNLEILDGALIGVELPPGQHTVELSYWPAGLTLGLAITGLSLLVVAGLWYAERRGMRWTRLGLEPPDRVVADEADDESDDEPPEDDLPQPAAP